VVLPLVFPHKGNPQGTRMSGRSERSGESRRSRKGKEKDPSSWKHGLGNRSARLEKERQREQEDAGSYHNEE
jgi:hypothetical protein